METLFPFMIYGDVACIVLLLGVPWNKQEVTRCMIHIKNSSTKVEILSSFTNPHAVTNWFSFFCGTQKKKYVLVFVHTVKFIVVQKMLCKIITVKVKLKRLKIKRLGL